VKADDHLWSRNPDTGQTGFKPVEATFVRETDRLVHLTYRRTSARTPGSARRGEKGGESRDGDPDDAAAIVGTAEHPLWSLTRDCWVNLGELQPGERLLLADGAEGVVVSVRTEFALSWGRGTLGTPTNGHGLFSVYNFKVHDWPTYHVAESVDQPFVFVHNAACIPDHLTSHPNAHGVPRHGGAVTDAQLQARARTGLTPDGVQRPIPRVSSAFYSDAELVAADNALRAKLAGMSPSTGTVPVSISDLGRGNVGRGYVRIGPGQNMHGPLQRIELKGASALYEYNPYTGVWETITVHPN
jgi:hypothetical protein